MESEVELEKEFFEVQELTDERTWETVSQWFTSEAAKKDMAKRLTEWQSQPLDYRNATDDGPAYRVVKIQNIRLMTEID